MGFWKNSKYSYQQFIELPLEEVVILINSLSREDMIKWLSWNDPNGIYSDERSLKELRNVMSREEAVEIMLRQIEENRTA